MPVRPLQMLWIQNVPDLAGSVVQVSHQPVPGQAHFDWDEHIGTKNVRSDHQSGTNNNYNNRD